MDQLKSKEARRLNILYEARVFTDITIKAQNRSIKAHKALLAACSPVLATQLLQDKNMKVLKLSVDFELLEEMINFIYDGQVEDQEKIAKLLAVADQFKMDRLKKYCEKNLFENLSVENAIDSLKLSDKHNAKQLKEECLEFIKK
jgi:speckle-type POZ protein